jgi:hypothetical protein
MVAVHDTKEKLRARAGLDPARLQLADANDNAYIALGR